MGAEGVFMAKKKAAKKKIKKASRKGPTRKCEKCGTSYHPRSAACPKCGAANPSLRKIAPKRKKVVRKKKVPAKQKPASDVTMTAVNFVEVAGGVEQAQEALDGLKQLFRPSTQG
jgi:uncharacterized OB-fold protein